MLRLNIDSLTITIRYGFYALVDIGLPYYVASRIANNHTALKQIIYTIWYACLVTALLAIYETATNKLLYESLQTTLNQYWGYGRTLMRGDRLRAQTITGQPIALGYVMMIGLSMHCFVAGQKLNKTITQIASIALVGGLIASISRGPWIGAAAAIVTYAALSAKSLGSIFKFTIATIAVSVVVLNSPWADAIKSHLPFIGTVENENITYRQNLLEFSIQVIAQNPFFGAYDYLYHPALQSLRQETANGLIDVVNTYVGIAMSNGLVGLTFFLGAFLLSTLACWRRMKATSSTDTWERNIGRTLIAAIVGIMVTIFTTSSITVIPTFYWLIIGLAVAYARLADSKVTATQAAAQPDIGKPQKNATIWAGTPTPPHA
jgi:O-antigen ligase